MEEEITSVVDFVWYSVAMFYKYSTAPYYISIVYALMALKDWPFVYSDKSFSLFWLIGILMFTLIVISIKLESEPTLFKQIFPSKLIQNEDSFINQYRLLITFLRWLWLFTVYYLLIVNTSMEECTMTDLLALKQCHKKAVISDNILLLVAGYGIIIGIYILLCRNESKTQHDKQE